MSCMGLNILSNRSAMSRKSISDPDSILNENDMDLHAKCTSSFDSVCAQEYRIGSITGTFPNASVNTKNLFLDANSSFPY
jgi:hypothetical protein